MNPTQSDPTPEVSNDDLVQRYREASRFEGASPGPTLRATVLTQAKAVARERAQASPSDGDTSPSVDAEGVNATSELNFSAGPLAPMPRAEAANDRRWAVPAVASLAVLGLAALLALQFDRGTDQRHERTSQPQAVPAAPPEPTRPAPTPPPTRERAEPAPAQGPSAQTQRANAQADRKAAAGSTSRASPAAVPDMAGRARAAPSPTAGAPADPVDATDREGRTALMRAAARGDDTQVHELLAAGADPRRTDALGLSAADYARQAGHARLAQALERAHQKNP